MDYEKEKTTLRTKPTEFPQEKRLSKLNNLASGPCPGKTGTGLTLAEKMPLGSKDRKSQTNSMVLDKSAEPTPKGNDEDTLSLLSRLVPPEQIHKAFATADPFLLVPLINQTKLASFVGNPKDPLTDAQTHLYVVGLMQSFQPRDAYERFLAMQMLATHTIAMDCLALAQHGEQTEPGRETFLSRGAQMMRLYLAQLEALKRYRSTGEQRCTVEHVHVYGGAQAVVGTINENRNSISNVARSKKKGKD